MRINPAIALSLLTALSPINSQAQPRNAPEVCRPSGPPSRLMGVSEASGLAISRTLPGRFWTHNDSGKPVLIGIDGKGAVTAQVEVTGVRMANWEAVAVASCPSGSCVYLGDIGDNAAARKFISVYRVPEPAAGSSVAPNAVFHAAYPDGAQDAEAMLVMPDARIYIVTKGETGPVSVYRFPAAARAGVTVTLERVGAAISNGKPANVARITDGSVSPDGQWTVLRSRASLAFYRTADFVAGNFREVKRVDLKAAGEAQGEGVAIGADHVVYLAGEGGGRGLPGTFTHFTCKLNP